MKIFIACSILPLALATNLYAANSVNHEHNGRSHSHPLPSTGLNHSHGKANTGNKKAVLHNHGERKHSHVLPKSGSTHSHGSEAQENKEGSDEQKESSSSTQNAMTNIDHIRLTALTNQTVSFEREITAGRYIGKLKAKEPNAYQSTLSEIQPSCQKAVSGIEEVFDFKKKMDKLTYEQTRKNIVGTCFSVAREHLIKEAADIRAYVKKEFH